MPVNLVDLGVIYGIAERDGVVEVDLTFTAMGCPASDFILDDVRERLLREDGVREVRVNVVWDPPWTAARITQADGRRLLQELLMPPLDGTLSLTERQRRAVPIGEHLHLDVTRVRKVALEIDIRAGKGCLGRPTAGLKGPRELLGPLGDPHSDSAPTSGGFDQHGVPDPRGLGDRRVFIAQGSGPRHDGDTRLGHSTTRLDFVAHGPHAGRGRPDKGQAVVGAGLREAGILGKKSVAGMDGIGTLVPRDPEQLIDIEIGLPWRWTRQGHAFVREVRMGSARVRLRIDGDRRNPHLAAGPHHAKRDLPAIGDQDPGDASQSSSGLRWAPRWRPPWRRPPGPFPPAWRRCRSAFSWLPERPPRHRGEPCRRARPSP